MRVVVSCQTLEFLRLLYFVPVARIDVAVERRLAPARHAEPK